MPSKKGVPTVLLGDALDALYTISTLFKEQGPESHINCLDTVEIALKLEDVLLLVCSTLLVRSI